MRWRIGFLLAALALLLSGCAAEYAWETVEDVLPETVQASAPAYRLMLGVAEDVLAPVFSDDGMTAVYEQKNGDYEITAQTLPAMDKDCLVRRLSGFSPEQIAVVQTQRFGMPEYQFAWYASGEEGGRLCRADVLCDGTWCYAVTFSVKEDCSAAYDAAAEQGFANLGLNADADF